MNNNINVMKKIIFIWYLIKNGMVLGTMTMHHAENGNFKVDTSNHAVS